jgi:hypothetical protein
MDKLVHLYKSKEGTVDSIRENLDRLSDLSPEELSAL